ncbi:SH3 domain-containing protein [Patescibacteria group bacterium]|nr:SH3 domain-containing protein [Patescibacteria group bacterium]
MKKILLYLIPFLIAIIAFSALVYLLNQKSGKGALQVTSTPQSKVYLDGKFIGTTSLCKCEASNMLQVGDYTIQLIPVEGDSSPFQEKITINKSTLTVVDKTFGAGGTSQSSIISLSPLADKKRIELLVISFPEKANVFLDNNPVGITPLRLKDITESDHDLKLTKDGYIDKLVKIRTTQGFQLKSVVFLGVNPNVASASGQASATSSATPAVSEVIILDTPTGFLRVRESNSLGSSEIDKVNPGDTFDLVSEKEDWFEIKLKNGKTGWVSTQYAKKK